MVDRRPKVKLWFPDGLSEVFRGGLKVLGPGELPGLVRPILAAQVYYKVPGSSGEHEGDWMAGAIFKLNPLCVVAQNGRMLYQPRHPHADDLLSPEDKVWLENNSNWPNELELEEAGEDYGQ